MSMESAPARAGNPARSGELVSLSERMGYLQALRTGICVVVLGGAAFASDALGVSIADLLLVTASYLFLSSISEGLRVFSRTRGLTIVSALLLVDGLYLAWVMYATGATQSPLRFLVYLHLIGVTLLASYRTGLKIALWHSLLLFVVFYAQAADILPPLAGSQGGADQGRPSLFNVMAFWLVALVTTAFSSLNERELRRRKLDLEALTAMSHKLEHAVTPEEVARIVLTDVGDAFRIRRGYVLMHQAGKAPQALAYRGPGPMPEVPGAVDSVVRTAFESREIQLVHRLEQDENPMTTAILLFARNVIVAPLFAEGEPVGALILERGDKDPGRLEKRIVSMIDQFATHGGLALRNSLLLEQISLLAATDALTGLANRRIFEESLEHELSRATRQGDDVTLVMIDLDHFKNLNDSHGHQVGDEVLRHVGRRLREQCRDFDTPTRYGGEEFAVILPRCSEQESLEVAERMRRSLSEGGPPVPITASAGVATFPSQVGSPGGLIQAADHALYVAKGAGRDRTSRWTRASGEKSLAGARHNR
jgi:two-component system cell cycle response regulator